MRDNIKTEAKREKRALKSYKILGVKVDSTSMGEVLEKIEIEKLFLISVNPEYIVQAQTDEEFRVALNNADLALADGVGLKLVIGDLEIIPGRKLAAELLALRRYKFFFLGGRGNVAKEMANKFGGSFDSGETDLRYPKRNEEIIAKINKSRADILLTAYNAPEQEKWLWANRKRLKVRVMMGVGGTFDYLTGRAKLPPKFIERCGLEWLWRLMHEPWRWRRQLKLVEFVWRILWAK